MILRMKRLPAVKARRCRSALACCASVAVLLVQVSAAGAAAHSPTGKFAQFAECPLSQKKVNNCFHSVSTSGSLRIGKVTVPLKNPITLQGGSEGSGSALKVSEAENGETMSKTPQPVRGGLVGVRAPTWWPSWLQKWFNGGVEDGLTNVSATLELALPAMFVKLSVDNLGTGKGTALGLPVRIKLDNPLLGDNCHIGSDDEPLRIDLTSGRSGDLTGAVGRIKINPEYTLATVRDGRLVNNDFSAPGARGCGGIFSFFVDPFVSSIFGLPTASGENSAILEGKFQAGAASAVKESE